MALTDLSIVVVSHNAQAVLAECLRRLSIFYAQAEVIVVDSGSTDGSAEWVKVNHPSLKVLEIPNNGYPYAVNRGLEAAGRNWLVQMNSDIYLEAGDLEYLIEVAQSHPKAALVGPILITPRGKPQSFGLFYAPNYWNLRQPRRVGWISGALTLMPRWAYRQIGGMDEQLFFYNDDIEWCWRARKQGLEVLFTPLRVLHLGGASTPKDPRFLAEGYRGGLYLTRLYLPALWGFHQKVVWLEAHLRLLFDPHPMHREAYGLIVQMLREDRLEQSFFRVKRP